MDIEIQVSYASSIVGALGLFGKTGSKYPKS